MQPRCHPGTAGLLGIWHADRADAILLSFLAPSRFGIVWYVRACKIGGWADYRLAATLGPRATVRKITKKQLVNVDLTRTCELIARPPEPMALRLSGALLVGVARSVFDS